MPIAELVTALERDADAEIQALLEAATADAARLDAEAERARQARLAGAGARTAAECQAAADAALAAATRRARGEVLAAQAALLERVRAALAAALPSLLEGDVGARLVADAVACAGDVPGVVRCAPCLAAVARASVPATLRVEADAAVATGVVVELATGARIEATLARLADREWPRLAIVALAEALAAAPPPGAS